MKQNIKIINFGEQTKAHTKITYRNKSILSYICSHHNKQREAYKYYLYDSDTKKYRSKIGKTI